MDGAVSVADARHAEIEAAWREERKQKERELQQLAEELDGLRRSGSRK